ncbi:GtrA family protein [Sporomusa malonica]|nr:GtrA family protein [Sporomusa malonica]
MLMKFAVVGLSGVGVNMAVYTFLTSFGTNFLIAAGFAFGVAVTNNFVWNVLWTFKGRAKDRNVKIKFVSFLAISVINLGVNLMILRSLVEFMQVNEILAQLTAIAVASSLNFGLNFLITFREKRQKQRKEETGTAVHYEDYYPADLQ